jgi:two-component system sensor histidine kinase TctE
VRAENGEIDVEVADRGPGLDEGVVSSRAQGGLAGMRERVQALMHATDRSARLAHQLLSLALAEPEASAAAAMTQTDLVAIARDVTADWVPRALVRQLDLGFAAAAGEVRIRGNTVLLRELAANLVDNAIRYTQPGGRITVDVQHDAATATLSVEDDGPGIPAGDRERVFERFQRLEETGTEGCGLGLAIVREIAQAHAAEVRLDDGAGGKGTRVSVRFARVDAGGDGKAARQMAAASGAG